MILITGASGFVGGHLICNLFLKGKDICALRRKNTNFNQLRLICSYYKINFDSLFAQVKWIEADLTDFQSLIANIRNVEEVYHCAAVVSFDSDDNKSLTDINVTGTKNLIEVCKTNQVQKFCFVSSTASLGRTPDSKFIDENSAFDLSQKTSTYSLTKYQSEQVVWDAINKGFNALIVNPGIILGIGDITKSSLKFFDMVKKGLYFYTCGGSGYVDVRDVCAVMMQGMENNIFSKRYVLVSENLSFKEILCKIAKGYNKRGPIIKVGKAILYLNYYISNALSSKPVITKENIRTATRRSYFNNHLAKTDFKFSFIPIDETINDVCEFDMKTQN